MDSLYLHRKLKIYFWTITILSLLQGGPAKLLQL